MPLQATSGAASYDAFGGGVPVVPTYIEDVFSTFLYQGNGSTQTINNGIDLAGKGGLVWLKSRSAAANHRLTDTVKGVSSVLSTNLTGAAVTTSDDIASFNANGFGLTDPNVSGISNVLDRTYASWTFREQPKFFDVVTYTGNGSTSGQTINHNLGSKPGTIIIKRTDATSDWIVQSRVNDTTYSYGLKLNSTAAQEGTYTPVDAQLNSTQFSNFIADNPLATNTNGATYVAYLFAHNAGGFGLSGTDNVISCGSFTTNSSAQATITLGYEPQWLLIKRTDGAGNWQMMDIMRGNGSADGNVANQVQLFSNLSNAEGSPTYGYGQPTATGFYCSGQTAINATYIYIAIRRGPMKTPTSGTSVFDPELTAAAAGTTVTTNFPIDLQLYRATGVLDNIYAVDRLRGVNTTAVNTVTPLLFTNTTGAEATDAVTRAWNNTGFQTPLTNGGTSSIYWNFRRAPGFFDEVCYTGTGVARTVAHNLGVAPELMIVRRRSGATEWFVYSATLGVTKYLWLQSTNAEAAATSGIWNSTTPTASVFSLGNDGDVNGSGDTYVNYLFASCPGVSKVGSYTGNGSSQTINMGFTGGARFFLVKRTDSTGDWWVYDSARGIVSAADPALRLNSTAAEVTSADAVDTDSTGLIVNQESTCNINVSSATYIYLGIS